MGDWLRPYSPRKQTNIINKIQITMELNELKDIVAKAKANEEQNEINRLGAEEREKQRIIKYLDDNWMPKIRKWIETLNYLAEQGYKFDTFHHSVYNSVPECFRVCTDGIDHNFGMWGKNGAFSPFPTGFYYMGIAQGGACGEYDIYTDGYDWWTENGNIAYVMRLADYKCVIREYRGLDAFEERYNELMDYLRNKAK